MKSTGKSGQGGGGKEINLASAEEGGTLKGIYGHCNKKYVYKRKDCILQKKVNRQTRGGANFKTCRHCNGKGHGKDSI